jgi:chemotaxis protein MotA
MNVLSVIAFVMAAVVLVLGVQSAGRAEVFLDGHAILIVLGGTLAASAIAIQVDRLFLLFRIFFRRVIRGHKQDYVKLIEELMRIAEAYRVGSPQFQQLVDASEDPFLKEAMGAIQDQVLDEAALIRVLRARVGTMYQRQAEDVVKFRTVGKYPPAFGLMGTTLSMITLLQKLGQAGAQKEIGPAMALGLVATFYGLALANLVFNPVAENLADSAKENRLKNTIIVEGARLILARTNPVALAEELNSFLLPAERVDWKKAARGQRSAA